MASEQAVRVRLLEQTEVFDGERMAAVPLGARLLVAVDVTALLDVDPAVAADLIARPADGAAAASLVRQARAARTDKLAHVECVLHLFNLPCLPPLYVDTVDELFVRCRRDPTPLMSVRGVITQVLPLRASIFARHFDCAACGLTQTSLASVTRCCACGSAVHEDGTRRTFSATLHILIESGDLLFSRRLWCSVPEPLLHCLPDDAAAAITSVGAAVRVTGHLHRTVFAAAAPPPSATVFRVTHIEAAARSSLPPPIAAPPAAMSISDVLTPDMATDDDDDEEEEEEEERALPVSPGAPVFASDRWAQLHDLCALAACAHRAHRRPAALLTDPREHTASARLPLLPHPTLMCLAGLVERGLHCYVTATDGALAARLLRALQSLHPDPASAAARIAAADAAQPPPRNAQVALVSGWGGTASRRAARRVGAALADHIDKGTAAAATLWFVHECEAAAAVAAGGGRAAWMLRHAEHQLVQLLAPLATTIAVAPGSDVDESLARALVDAAWQSSERAEADWATARRRIACAVALQPRLSAACRDRLHRFFLAARRAQEIVGAQRSLTMQAHSLAVLHALASASARLACVAEATAEDAYVAIMLFEESLATRAGASFLGFDYPAANGQWHIDAAAKKSSSHIFVAYRGAMAAGSFARFVAQTDAFCRRFE